MEEKSREALSEASAENVEYIIEWIKKKVNIVNRAVINSQHIDLAHYDTLLDLYDLLRKKRAVDHERIGCRFRRIGSNEKKFIVLSRGS